MAPPGESTRLRVGLVLVAVLFGLLAVPMVRGEVLVRDDLAFYYLPVRSFFARCVATGQDPAWFPNLFNGFYLYGEGNGLAHPWVQFLYAALPLDVALNVERLSSYPALLAGFVLLASRWGLRRDAALFGGMMFAFGGYNQMQYMHMHVVAMVAHLPWLLLAIDVTLRARDPRRAALARVAVALLTASQVLLGHVQYAWISGVCEAAYTLFLAWQVPGAARRLPGLAVSKALGVLGGAAQLAPLWDAFGGSRRERPSVAFVALGSLPPLNLVQWVAPYLSVSRVVTPPMVLDTGVTAGVLPPAPTMNDWRVQEFAIYYGASVPALLAWLVVRRKDLGGLRSLSAFAASLALGAFVLSLGEYSPLFGLTIKIPVVGQFRVPARYLVHLHLGVALLGSVAFARLCEATTGAAGRLPWRRLWPLAVPPALSVLVCLGPKLPEGLWPWYLRGQYVAALPLVLAGPVLVCAATALVACAARGSRYALVALFVLAAADQAAYGAHHMALTPPQSVAAFLEARPVPPGGNKEGSRVKFDRLAPNWQNAYTMKGLRTISGYIAMAPRQQLKYDRPSTLRVAGVGWAMPTEDERGQPWTPVAGALPRARLVTRTKPSSDPDRDIDTIDVATTALVDGDVSLPPGQPGRATLVGDRPGALDLVTEAWTRQLLVVSESHHRGWRVEIGGRPQPLLRVNGDFLGCVVPRGRHHVRLRFRPSSLRVGRWLSVLGVVLATAVPLLPLRGGDRAPTAPAGPGIYRPWTGRVGRRVPGGVRRRVHVAVPDRAAAWTALRRRALLRLLRMHHESGVGHIGGNLSCMDLMLALHHDVLGPSDQFVLSKGHAAGAYYVTLWTLGRLPEEELRQFHGDGTRLCGHPPAAGIDDILFATGSLGHGLSLAAGLALGKRLKGEPGRVVCLTSDGEWNEGSCWEALIFARQRRLTNLTIVVDLNGLQGFGATRDVADLEPLAEKFRGFGVPALEIDGHDPEAIGRALRLDRPGPCAVVARTRKGCGISFMEGRMEWHYLPLTGPQYEQAVREIERACATSSARHSWRPQAVPSSSS